MSDSIPAAKPVFFKSSIFPPNSVSYISICQAAEKSSGANSVFGMQKVGGVFRLYPSSEVARTRLLTAGFAIQGVRVLPMPINPRKTFLLDGKEVFSSRLTISNIPLSVCGADILTELKSAGYSPLSQLGLDCIRDQAGALTRFRNGNRSIFILTPTKALPKTIKIQGKFTAFLFYPEREQVERVAVSERATLTPPQPCSPAVPAGPTFDPVNESSASDDTLTSPLDPSDQREGGVKAVVSGSRGPREGGIEEETADSPAVKSTCVDNEGKVGEGRESNPQREVNRGGASGSPVGVSPVSKGSERKSRARAKSVSPRPRRDTSSIARYFKNLDRASSTTEPSRSSSRKRLADRNDNPSSNKRSALS